MRKRESSSKKRNGSNHHPSGNNHQPTHETIAVRAYEIYVNRGAYHGRDLDDWLEAERELMGKDQNTIQHSALSA